MQDAPQPTLSSAQIIAKLASRFQAEAAADMTATFQFRLSESFSFYIAICDRQCKVNNGEHDDPDIILIMQETTFIDLMTGKIDGMSAFMKGDLKAHGNVILATSLGKLFKKRAGDDQKLSSQARTPYK